MIEFLPSESEGQTGEAAVPPRPADDVPMSGGCTNPAAQENTAPGSAASEQRNTSATASAPASEAAGPPRDEARDQAVADPSGKGEAPAPERSKFCNKRTPAQVEYDRILTEELTLKGVTQTEIARQINAGRPPEQHISREQVRNEIAIIKIKWQEEQQQSVDEYRAELLQQHYAMRRELWEAWEKSKEDAKRWLEEHSGSDGKGDRTRMERIAQCGDPRYPALMVTIDKEIAKLQGLYPSARAGQGSYTAGGAIQLVCHVEPAQVLGPPAQTTHASTPAATLNPAA